MSEVFANYADFYDALYADKDYEAECDFLESVFERHASQRPSSVLDLGCGTGGHVLPLARRSYAVTGVDRAAAMLEQAREKARAQGLAADFVLGDVRSFQAGRTFDAVVSMFAVVSYQLTNADLLATLHTARRHLEVGGLFVFDGWFGPAVLSQRPRVSTKVVTTADGDTITRTGHPHLDVVAQTVTIDYEVVRERDGAEVERTVEAHTVRFLFAREIELLLDASGFELAALGPFMELDRSITAEDWNVSVVARAR